MKTVLFIILPYPSHYFSCFPLANCYREQGHRVIFTGLTHLENLVTDEGFEFIPMMYPTKNLIISVKSFFGYFILTALDYQARKKMYKDWFASVLSFKEILRNFSVSTILIDEHLNYFALIAEKYVENIILVNTKLSTSRRKGIPPLNSTFVPTFSFISNTFSSFLWLKNKLYRKSIGLIEQIAFFNMTENYFKNRLLEKCQTTHKFIRDSSFYDGLTNYKTIILGPKEMDFEAQPHQNGTKYINLKMNRSESRFLTTGYYAIKNEIIERKKNENKRLIYISFGTIPDGNHSFAYASIQKIVRAAMQIENVLILVTIPQLDVNDTEKKVYFSTFFPQIDVLTYTDLMITHGGLTSVKECLQHNVPMLVYPLNINIDQAGNGARVLANNWGLMGNLRKDTDIQAQIQQALLIKKSTLSTSDLFLEEVETLTMDSREIKNKFSNF